MFAHFGIDKSDVEIIFNILLTVSNFYWMSKFNNIKVNNQMFTTLKDENEAQEIEIRELKHQVLVEKIRKRKHEATNSLPLA